MVPLLERCEYQWFHCYKDVNINGCFFPALLDRCEYKSLLWSQYLGYIIYEYNNVFKHTVSLQLTD